MQTNKILTLAVALGLSANLCIADTFDMGKVQVVGKDAQSEKIDPARHKINFEMGERFAPMPQMIPDVSPQEFRPMTEKQILDNFHREEKDELSAAIGLGTRGSNELIVNGKGSRAGYIGDIIIRRESRDGYHSNIDSKHSGIEATVTNTAHGSYVLSGSGEYSNSEFAQRGTKSRPTPDAGIEDGVFKLGFAGHSTLEDGSFMTGFLDVGNIDREIRNSETGYSEDQTLKTFSAGVTYLKSLGDRFKGRAGINVKNDKVDFSNSANRSFTKSDLSLGVDYELSEKALAKVGFRYLDMKDRNGLSPFASIDYQLSEPWKLSLGYSEDYGNDSLERLYLPSRYVVGDDFKASKIKTLRASANYKTDRGDTLGLEVFNQKESDGIEFLDEFDPGKAMLTSRLRTLSEIARKGTAISGAFKIEDNFTINLKGTFQNPEDNATGRRISYEPKRILDVGLNYSENRLMIDFTRRAEFDRVAHTPLTSFDAQDYSRSDLAARYKLNNRFSVYLKIKDIYDEAKMLRHEVAEEGRVSLAGLEAHF